jgi:LmbE family N-acetylglucosaminyl deacetylase
MTVLVCVAHPDDEAIGVGGTIAKYAKEGEKVISIIFSLGEGSNPLLDPDYLTKRRQIESKKVGKLLGVKEVLFMGLSDIGFLKDISSEDVRNKFKIYLKKYKPELIFTHCLDDPHPHHRVISQLVKCC